MKKSVALHILLSTALVCGFMFRWRGSFFSSHDSLYISALAKGNFHFSTIIPQHYLNPLSGYSGIFDPINVWLNPLFAIQGSGGSGFLDGYIIHFGLVACSFVFVFGFGRLMAISSGASLIGAWLFSVSMFPTIPGILLGQFALVAPEFIYHGLWALLALGLFYQIGKVSKESNVLMVFCFVVATLFVAYISPMHGVLFALLIIAGAISSFTLIETKFELGWKLGGGLLAVGVVAATGFFPYVIDTAAYTPRILFSDFFIGRAPEFELRASHFLRTDYIGFKVTVLMMFVISSFLVYRNANKKSWGLLIASWVLVLLQMILIFTYLSLDSWSYSDPAYFEFMALALMGLVIGQGAEQVLFAAKHRFRILLPLTSERSILISLVAGCVLIWTFNVVKVPPPINIREPNRIEEYLSVKLTINEGKIFSGKALYASPPEVKIGEDATENMNLWNQLLPSFYEAAIFSPPEFYVLWADKRYPDGKFRVEHIADQKFFPLMQSYGVRYLISKFELKHPQLKKVLLSNAGDSKYTLYEFTNPNLNGFSPQSIKSISNSRSLVGRLRSQGVALTKEAFVLQGKDVQLVPAKASSIVWIHNGFEVKAISEGESVLVLPMPFSNCLNWYPNDKLSEKAKILRVNLAQAAIKFDKGAHGRLIYEYGPLQNMGCKSKDRQDVDAMKIREVLSEFEN